MHDTYMDDAEIDQLWADFESPVEVVARDYTPLDTETNQAIPTKVNAITDDIEAADVEMQGTPCITQAEFDALLQAFDEPINSESTDSESTESSEPPESSDTTVVVDAASIRTRGGSSASPVDQFVDVDKDKQVGIGLPSNHPSPIVSAYQPSEVEAAVHQQHPPHGPSVASRFHPYVRAVPRMMAAVAPIPVSGPLVPTVHRPLVLNLPGPSSAVPMAAAAPVVYQVPGPALGHAPAPARESAPAQGGQPKRTYRGGRSKCFFGDLPARVRNAGGVLVHRDPNRR